MDEHDAILHRQRNAHRQRNVPFVIYLLHNFSNSLNLKTADLNRILS